MYIFSRLLTLTGSPRRSMPWAAEITAYVNAHSDLNVALWSTLFGNPVGTLAWTAQVDSHAALAAATAGLAADSAYLDLVEKAADLVSAPAQDSFRQVVHGDLGEPPAIGSVAGLITAVVAGGKQADALAWGVETSKHVTAVTGVPVAFCADLYGTFGQVTWIALYPDMAILDKAQDVLAGDADYAKRLSKAGDLFLPGSGSTRLSTRVA
jgi:hypothetical protein